MSRIFSVSIGILILLYPLAVYLGINSLGIKGFALVAGFLFLLRLIYFSPLKNIRNYPQAIRLLAVFGLALAGLAWLRNEVSWLQYYPVIVNVSLLIVFSLSLLKPPSIIESLARIKEPDLPQAAVVYTRNVTVIWCLFFAINGSIALYTVLADDLELWTLYNGLVSYLLIGLIVSLEILFRHFWRKKIVQSS